MAGRHLWTAGGGGGGGKLSKSDRPLVSKVKDAGGSMTIHTFGDYFGLTVTWILYRPNLSQSKERDGPVYHSDLFAMIGESGTSP